MQDMKYIELQKETNEEVEERLELVLARVAEIAVTPEVEAPFDAYFKQVAEYLLLLASVLEKAENGSIASIQIEEGKALNEKLYADVRKEQYETSFANPAYAAGQLGKEYGQLLSAIYARVRGTVKFAFEGNKQYVCIFSEMFVELHTCFENVEEVTPENVKDILYWFEHDYTEVFNAESINRLVNPDYDYVTDIVMNSDLKDLSYLYRYGLHVGDNETGIA